MQFQSAQQYIEDCGTDGYAVSVATDKELRIIKTYVDADDLGHPDVAIGIWAYPMLIGGKYNGHRLIHHSIHVEVGQRLINSMTKKEK